MVILSAGGEKPFDDRGFLEPSPTGEEGYRFGFFLFLFLFLSYLAPSL